MASFTNPQTGEIWFVSKYTGAQTDKEVIAAPAAGKTILLHWFDWSASADAEIFLEQGSTLVAGQFAGANGGKVVAASSPFLKGRGGIRLTPATSLTLTTDAGNCYVEIMYSIVDD